MRSYLYYRKATCFAILNVALIVLTKMTLVAETAGLYEARALTKCAVVGALLFVVYKITSIGARGRKLPPGMHSLSMNRGLSDAQLRKKGPRTVPVLGNEHQIPAADGHFL